MRIFRERIKIKNKQGPYMAEKRDPDRLDLIETRWDGVKSGMKVGLIAGFILGFLTYHILTSAGIINWT